MTVFVATSIAALHLLLVSQAGAMPARFTFRGLVHASDLIVVGRVESIRGTSVVGKRWATLRVSEVWKGLPLESVEFLASPRREDLRTRLNGCYDPDVSDAKPGEVVLLFLAQEKGLGWVIMNKGRGRIPVRPWDGRAYADALDTLPTTEIPDGMGGSTSAVELSIVRDSVKRMLLKAK